MKKNKKELLIETISQLSEEEIHAISLMKTPIGVATSKALIAQEILYERNIKPFINEEVILKKILI